MATAVDSPAKVVRGIDAAVGTTQVTRTESARRRSAGPLLPPAPGLLRLRPDTVGNGRGQKPGRGSQRLHEHRPHPDFRAFQDGLPYFAPFSQQVLHPADENQRPLHSHTEE